MPANVEIVASIIGVLASALAGISAYSLKELFEKIIKQKKEKSKKEVVRNFELGVDLGILNFKHRIAEAAEPAVAQGTQDLIDIVEKEILERISDAPGLSKEQVRMEIDKKLSELRSRLETIESRFPNEAVIDKISSINDALLAERLDNLGKRIDAIEKKQLSKWDVAIVVSMVVAGIFSVVGATYGVINFITKN